MEVMSFIHINTKPEIVPSVTYLRKSSCPQWAEQVQAKIKAISQWISQHPQPFKICELV